MRVQKYKIFLQQPRLPKHMTATYRANSIFITLGISAIFRTFAACFYVKHNQ